MVEFFRLLSPEWAAGGAGSHSFFLPKATHTRTHPNTHTHTHSHLPQAAMPFVKAIKSKAYFSRYQVKYRRRREGKTDYARRRKLVTNQKNKYESHKYRLVVRVTNQDVICQLAYAKIAGDIVVAAAYAHELPRYGIKAGLTNYAAAYATGLLLARRHLTNLGLADSYVGQVDADGKVFKIEKTELDEVARPFKALLDVGLARTTTGSKVFAALKGACDGGLHVPHSPKRFAGFQNGKLNSEVLKERIFGGHVEDHMRLLQERADGSYERQYSRYIKNGITADDVEDMYRNAHAAIRKDPSAIAKKPRQEKPKAYNKKRMSLSQRKDRVKQKLNTMAARVAAAE
jgi:large subunit ribosomal protein L5e